MVRKAVISGFFANGCQLEVSDFLARERHFFFVHFYFIFPIIFIIFYLRHIAIMGCIRRSEVLKKFIFTHPQCYSGLSQLSWWLTFKLQYNNVMQHRKLKVILLQVYKHQFLILVFLLRFENWGARYGRNVWIFEFRCFHDKDSCMVGGKRLKMKLFCGTKIPTMTLLCEEISLFM